MSSDANVAISLQVNSGMMKTSLAALLTVAFLTPTNQQKQSTFGPGARVLLDAHNSYPESGQWADRIERALATGTPVAIEQDLYWRHESGNRYSAVVAHDSEALAGAPTFERYFFKRVQPIMERTLKENRRETWPLIVLNLDLKTNQRELHAAILSLLEKHDNWLTTAPRTPTPEIPEALTVGPMLVFSGADSTQRRDFHDIVPIGGRIRAFGAAPIPSAPGATGKERTRNQVHMSAQQLIPARISNYARWVNFPWSVVEEGGQNEVGAFTADDSTRLQTLVQRAHANGLWIRFYTLDGFSTEQDKGFTASYNFGSQDAAAVRWRAVIAAGVDFVATDQYAEFADVKRRRIR